jgi:AcrR family transcriptional regulator
MSLREEIIHQSLRLFSTKGYINTGINDIISASNSSKGGFYNHFASKEELFCEVLGVAQQIWRERTLFGLKEMTSPTEKLIGLLNNYRDRYLIDIENFPGGCVFVTFSVELDDQIPHLAKEVDQGFVGLKKMIKRFLDEGIEQGELNAKLNSEHLSEMIFAGMLGGSVIFGMDKSIESLNRVIDSLIFTVENLIKEQNKNKTL